MNTTTTGTILAFIDENPTREGGSWSGWGGSLAFRIQRALGHEPKVYPSAGAAFMDTKIVSLDSTAAPAGAVHYWLRNDGQLEHANAGIDIIGGGDQIIIATGRSGLGKPAGEGLAIVTEHEYTEWFDDHSYAGWSMVYGGINIHSAQAMITATLAGKFTNAETLRADLGEERARTLPELMGLVLDAAEADASLLKQMGFMTAHGVVQEATGQDVYALLRQILAAMELQKGGA